VSTLFSYIGDVTGQAVELYYSQLSTTTEAVKHKAISTTKKWSTPKALTPAALDNNGGYVAADTNLRHLSEVGAAGSHMTVDAASQADESRQSGT